MDEQILKKVYESAQNNIPVALVTLTKVGGSTPRDAGSIMAVYEDGTSFGSIGGGSVEYSVIKEAVQALQK
ncbi:MAG: XdhC family protein, partial [Campylobacteraceae bacterium]|nr:XdhC family protein [Campylobacteraceae bacterium]